MDGKEKERRKEKGLSRARYFSEQNEETKTNSKHCGLESKKKLTFQSI